MNRLNYASSQINGAISLLTAVSADVEDLHYGAVMGVVGQLEVIHEAMNIKGSASSAGEALRFDISAMLGESACDMEAKSLLDDYVSVRLESVSAAVLSIHSRYLDADDMPQRMIGNAMFEARQWIKSAKNAVDDELEALPSVYLAA